MTAPNLANTISLLSATPQTLDALLRGLPETFTLRNEGDATWSAFDVVGHLIHGERTNWMPRIMVVLESGELREFESFERGGHVRASEGKSL
jgi:hypothetical protein